MRFGRRATKDNNITINWLKVAEEQRDNAREIMASIMWLQSQPGVSQKDVSRIYSAAENHAQAFAHFYGYLNKYDNDEIVLEMAEAMKAIWDAILMTIAEHSEEP